MRVVTWQGRQRRKEKCKGSSNRHCQGCW